MGIKEPSITESFGVSFFARGNPNLEPERSRSFEVGVDQRLANDHAKLAVAYFDNRFEDIIWTETTDFTTFEGEYRNVVGLSRARGLEMQLEMAPFPVLRGRGGYTFLASKIEESSAQTVVFQEGEWAFRRPRHSGFVGVTLDWQRLTVDVSGLFIGRTVDSDFFVFDPPITEVPARTTWDTRVAYELTSRLSAIVAVDNLTDTDYMQPVGYQSLGRVVRAGVQVRY
jgi:vitamin B12 transporter